MLSPAISVDDFVSAPIGRYVVGAGFVYFCVEPELFGIVFFGRPGRADLEPLTRALLVELRPDVPPHRSYVDARRLEGVDAGAFETLNAYVKANHVSLKTQVSKLALVRPDGLEGAVVAGFYGVLDSPYPTSVFEDAADALQWLKVDAAVGAALDAIVASIVDEDPAVASLRALLQGGAGEIGHAAAAKALGLSERTLQRRLQDSGTTFQKEVVASRISRAQRRMLDTDEPLTAIAIDVGFSSLQHFSSAFREATGEPPSSWRARHK